VVGFEKIISLLGIEITQLALIIWVWEITRIALTIALVGFFTFSLTILISISAGA
jgi:hypothetical protein